MADSTDIQADASAEKAYAAAAAAAEAISELDAGAEPAEPETDVKVEDSAEPVEFPAKPKRGRKPRTAEASDEGVTAESPPVAVPAVAAVPAALPETKVHRAAPKPAKLAKPAIKRPAAKPVASAPVKVRKPSLKKVKPAPQSAARISAPKIAKASLSAAPKTPFITQLKELPMDMSASIKDAVSGAQDKAKEAFTKGSAFAGEYGDFAKGNVAAVIESGKILASGLQNLGSKFVEESKTAFETATADVKALASVKSPTDFFQLQTDLLRRNFGSAVAYTSKTGEAMVKLTGDVIAPLSGRVTLAVDKIKKAA